MIPFNVPLNTGNELIYIQKALKNKKLSGDGNFTRLCNKWFEETLNCKKAFLTTSCTHALEMAAILTNITDGDEVIMPSYTFASTANAFVLRGAKIVFVDICPETLNITPDLIEAAISNKTKVIVPVHYAGVSCEMNKIMEVANKFDILVVEDAAQAILSKFKNRFLGTYGSLGCISFHESKNINCGEGGVILINDEKFTERAEIIREKGTNRSKFFRGEIDKYSWLDIGSSYLPGELTAAYLMAQLENAVDIIQNRLNSYNIYYQNLKHLQDKSIIKLPKVTIDSQHNGHMFYIITKSLQERTSLISYLKEHNINSVFHYLPLHKTKAGLIYGKFHGVDKYTSEYSNRIIRLPMYYNISEDDILKVVSTIYKFYKYSFN
ncbi:MAG: dTDP-4-amino-4,6-dideoxygalactose transaminase [Cyanobacteriota bacterium]